MGEMTEEQVNKYFYDDNIWQRGRGEAMPHIE